MKLITFTGTGLFMVLSAFTLKNLHSGSSPVSSLYETKWYLTATHSLTGMEEVNGKTAFIKFSYEKNAAAGKGDCNSFGTTTVISNNKISFHDIFSTRMFCEGMQETENSFLKALEEVTRFEINNKTLLLYHDKLLLLEFCKE